MLTMNELSGLGAPHGGGGGHWHGGGGHWGGGWRGSRGMTVAYPYPACVDTYGRPVPCPTTMLVGLGDTSKTNVAQAAQRGSNMLRSPTMCMPQASSTVHQLHLGAAGSLLTTSVRTPGLGDGDINNPAGVPLWAWTAGGGLLAGILAGAFIFRKKG